MNYNHKSIQELESELFAIVSTINKIYEKYEKGKLNIDFFQKSFKNAVYDLLKIKFILKKKNIFLSEIIINKEFIDEYNNAIIIIDKVSKMNLPKELRKVENLNTTQYSHLINSSVLNLPGITSGITTSFITLMDAIKLNTSVGNNFILKIFQELNQQINEFPGLEIINKKLQKLYNHISLNINTLRENKKYRDISSRK